MSMYDYVHIRLCTCTHVPAQARAYMHSRRHLHVHTYIYVRTKRQKLQRKDHVLQQGQRRRLRAPLPPEPALPCMLPSTERRACAQPSLAGPSPAHAHLPFPGLGANRFQPASASPLIGPTPALRNGAEDTLKGGTGPYRRAPRSMAGVVVVSGNCSVVRGQEGGGCRKGRGVAL